MKNIVLKIIASIVLLATTCTICACQTPTDTKNSDTTTAPPPPIPSPAGIEINLPVELTAYNSNSFLKFMTDAERTLDETNQAFPIEYTKQLDPSHKCVIYKLTTNIKDMDTGVKKSILAYVLFELIPTEEGTEWINVHSEYYLTTKKYSSTDFSFLSEGLGREYFAFDVSTIVDTEIRFETPSLECFTSSTCRLLSDGVLVVMFKGAYGKGSNGQPTSDPHDLKIAEYHFYPYGSTDAPNYISAINYPDLLQEH